MLACATVMDLSQKIQTHLATPHYHPVPAGELARRLRLTAAERREFDRVVAALLAQGAIVAIRQNRLVLPREADLVIGRIQFNEKGFAFVVPDRSPTAATPAVPAADLYIAEEDTGVALHGDKVVARVHRDRRARPGTDKLAGRVIRIVERAHATLVGTLQKTRLFYYVVPDDPRFIHDIYTRPALNAAVGDKVVVKLADWTNRHVNPEGTIIERLGRGDAPGVDILAIIRKYHLPGSFPAPVQSEVRKIPAAILPNHRHDLRDQFILTIDPDDAKDFDDAVQVDDLPDGGWRLGVHIADVSHYVTPGSALDREAQTRGNSVYLVDRVVPMLPEELSNDLCSLRPREDRYTVSCFIEFTPKLTVRRTWFARSLIHSRHRLTYQEAYQRLRDAAPAEPLTCELHKMWRLADRLRHQRFAHGSLNLDFPEVKVRLDKQGRPVRLDRVEYDSSHQLIEEFMLCANEAVARHICQLQIPGLYRIHEDPDPGKLRDYREYARSLGCKVGDVTQRRELQKLLAAVRGQPTEYAVTLGLLRSLKQARYSPQPVGHYGLAKKYYTHFTSPIRRYADLVVHRTLLATLNRTTPRPSSPRPDLARLAEHISQTERNAAEAEKESVELKKIEYFQRQLRAGQPETFTAVVCGVRNFGLFVELSASLVQGLVHVSTLTDDFYQHDAKAERLVGKRTRRVIKIGDRVTVQVDKVDLFKRQIDFRLVQKDEPPHLAG